MGRRRGKGKKADTGSGEDEKLPVRRRGRPIKPTKNEFDEEDEAEKIEEEENDSEDTKSFGFKNQAAGKRKRPIKESVDSITEEKNNGNVLIKSVGFRQNGNRRKNKPRRAAEVGVECK